MGIFDRLRGKREDAAAEVSSAEAAAQVSPSLDLTEAAPAAAPTTSRQQEFSKQFGVAASDQLYNPYEVRRAQCRAPQAPLALEPYTEWSGVVDTAAPGAAMRPGGGAGHRPHCRRRCLPPAAAAAPSSWLAAGL